MLGETRTEARPGASWPGPGPHTRRVRGTCCGAAGVEIAARLGGRPYRPESPASRSVRGEVLRARELACYPSRRRGWPLQLGSTGRETDGLLSSQQQTVEGGAQRVYRATDAGRMVLGEDRRTLRELARAVLDQD